MNATVVLADVISAIEILLPHAMAFIVASADGALANIVVNDTTRR